MESILFYSKKMLVTFLLLLSLTPKDCTFTEILEQEWAGSEQVSWT